jgi:hypothetical protein
LSCPLVVRACVAAAVLAGGACVHQNVIAVAPGSTRDSLVLVIRGAQAGAPPNLLFGVSVIRCADERPMWTISADGSRTMPDTLLYGQVVPGFPVRVGPEVLHADCYQAIASGAAPFRFIVDAKGGVTAPP